MALPDVPEAILSAATTPGRTAVLHAVCAALGVAEENAVMPKAKLDLNKAYYGAAARPSDIVLVRNVKPNPRSHALHHAVVRAAGGG
jgi:hypothetical protein